MRIYWKRSAKYIFAAAFALILLIVWITVDPSPLLSFTSQGLQEDRHLAAHNLPYLSKLGIDRVAYEKRLTNYLEYRKAESSMSGPGEKGDPASLTSEEQKNYDAVFKKEAFNKIASDKISLDRSLRDMRPFECRALRYPKDLPTASVILIFNNEAWSPLLRTVHSVINRSPPRYLREVVLLDDASNRKELMSDLDRYVNRKWPDGLVRIVRKKSRQGLIRARLEGAKAAVGDVIIFLDSHCEVTEGWLEPLLARIHENRTAVLCPTIGVISATDMSFYSPGGVSSIGSFWWSLHFTWDGIPESERRRRNRETDPIRSPTMAGGLFAMDRKYFFELGAYDEGMEIWGGENLEISFRVWMCGGSLEFIPCSTVGHIFRASHPYGFPSNKDYHGMNSMRLAEVWMDEYKSLFYMHRKDLLNKDCGDLTSRKQLRSRLKCNNFQWYLDNVIPQKFVPTRNVRGYGYVRNPATNMCLDLLGQNEFDRGFLNVGVFSCQGGASGAQIFTLTNDKRIRREWGCLDIAHFSTSVNFITCNGGANQEWEFKLDSKTSGHIAPFRHVSSGKCLDVKGLKNGDTAIVSDCKDSPTQLWTLEHFLDKPEVKN